MTARLVSLNVGRPREVQWEGKTVRSAIWKDPVDGPRMVRRINIDGDDQADRLAHGGEHRAVFVYQIDSYRYWQRELGRDDFTYGQFGENFTVEGLADDEVCIGDRYRIGGALLTGVLANKALNGVADGVVFGNPWQLVVQGTAVLSTMVYSGVMSFGLLKLIGAITPLRAASADEAVGMDLSQHGEEAYVRAEGSAAALAVEPASAPLPALEPAPAMERRWASVRSVVNGWSSAS